jgi:hypothetical protein
MEFKDITQQCYIKFEKAPSYFTTYKKYVVNHVTREEGETVEIHLLDDDGDEDSFDADAFERSEGVVAESPTPKQLLAIEELDELVAEMHSKVAEVKKKAKDMDVEYDVVLLSDSRDIREWYSSNC